MQLNPRLGLPVKSALHLDVGFTFQPHTLVLSNHKTCVGHVHRQQCVMQALTGNHVGPTTAAASLEEMFSSGGGGGRAGTSKRVTVLLVDEMDLLVTKKQTVTT